MTFFLRCRGKCRYQGRQAGRFLWVDGGLEFGDGRLCLLAVAGWKRDQMVCAAGFTELTEIHLETGDIMMA